MFQLLHFKHHVCHIMQFILVIIVSLQQYINAMIELQTKKIVFFIFLLDVFDSMKDLNNDNIENTINEISNKHSTNDRSIFSLIRLDLVLYI